MKYTKKESLMYQKIFDNGGVCYAEWCHDCVLKAYTNGNCNFNIEAVRCQGKGFGPLSKFKKLLAKERGMNYWKRKVIEEILK